jgi:hypothetical protein
MRNMLTSLFSMVIAAIVAHQTAGPAAAQLAEPDYWGDVKRNFPTVVTVKITSANTKSVDDYVCFYEYGSSVTGVLRGHHATTNFPFYSQVGLAIGEEYLIYLSEADAKLPRFAISTPKERMTGCSKQISGYFFLYNEVALVKDVPKNDQLIRVVQFTDPWADYPVVQSTSEIINFVNFDYVSRQLKN